MSVIIMILLLSVLILVHEAGHYLAARMFGIKVDKFGFGLPIRPTLYEKKVGETTIIVHAFLLGGYVSFPDDEKDSDVPKDSLDRFANRPIYQRMIVISAGVIANIICAFVLVLMVAFFWGHMPSGKYDIYIKNIMAAKQESVWSSGLQNGDKVVEVNGSKTDTSYALLTFAQLSKRNDGKVDTVFVEKNYEKLKNINPAFTRDEIIPKDITIKLPQRGTESKITLSENVLKGLEKYIDKQIPLTDTQKNLRDQLTNKKFYQANGEVTLNDIAFALSDNARPIYLKVERESKVYDLKPIYPNKEGLIGVHLDIKEVLIPTKSPKTAVVTSVKYLCEQTRMLLYGLYQIFTGKIPLKDLHGIVAVTKIGGDIIEHNGFFSGLLLTAIISLDLAIVNFLPIPALDGGHFMFLIIEKITGKPLDEDTINLIGNIGFWILIILMILLVFNDVYALITQKL